jgi:hypothetical protein
MKQKIFLILILILITSSFIFCLNNKNLKNLKNEKKVLFLPLDERFTTRDILINLSKITPFKILTPSKDILCKIRKPTNMEELDLWMEKNVQNSDVMIISSEMFIFGGLIQSR